MVLYGHLCFYYKFSPQYYQMYGQLWDQAGAAALNQRCESSEDLLAHFEKLMHAHGYEMKAASMRVKDHRRRIEHIIKKLDAPLTKQVSDA